MYQVLYRKYRPKVFSDVYGQDHVTSTLRNEIKNGRVSHAYLFTGSRGTGKTTCAKILAKAVNCENNQDGEPCNECEVCRGIESGDIFDVVEIDAASNNGVDNIRDLREEANYTPSRGKYRVYIIDEVHMLSTGAFNALLKTLEEPPAHVIFILATTEVHKLPATILSRCQRFDFKRIQPETMSKRLMQVASLEGITLDDDAAILIARIADGALRDGLSILDQCASRSKEVNSALVSEVAGLAGREAMFSLSDCIAKKDSSAAISLISELYQNSFDMERLCSEMINHFRNLLVIKTTKNSRPLIICTDDEYNILASAASAFTLEAIINALDLFQNTLVTIKSGATARIEMEMALVRLCEPKLDSGINSILDRVSAVERAVRNGVFAAPVKAQAPETEAKPMPEEKPEPEKKNPFEDIIKKESKPEPQPEPQPEPSFEADETPLPPPVEEAPLPPVDEAPVQPPVSEPPAAEKTQTEEQKSEAVEFPQWGEFMDEIRKSEITLYSIFVGAKGYTRGDIFLIDSPNSSIGDFIKKNNYSKNIKIALYNITGKKYKIGIYKREQSSDNEKRDALDDLILRAQRKTNVEIK